MITRTTCVAVLAFLSSILVFSRQSQAQSFYYQWHYLLTQAGRNNAIYWTAQSVPNGTYGGQCKVWVQNVVWNASNRTVWLPTNSSNCDWMWNWSSDVEIVAQDRWDGVAFRPGQIVQAQVRYSQWPYTSPHTMIIAWADANYVSVIESNFGSGNYERVNRRTVTWAQFKSSIIHYTLYNVR